MFASLPLGEVLPMMLVLPDCVAHLCQAVRRHMHAGLLVGASKRLQVEVLSFTGGRSTSRIDSRIQ